MVSSMTAFARSELQTPQGLIVWEIRALNQRYLDLNFKLPEEWRFMEAELRDILRKNVTRGKIECFLRFQQNLDAEHNFQLNEALGKAVCKALEQINVWVRHPSPVSPFDILSWPGMIQADQSVQLTIAEQINAAFKKSLKELNQARQREGSALKNIILQQLQKGQTIVDSIKLRIPDVLKWQHDKLVNRLAEYHQNLDAGRLEQEMVLLATKMDIREELDRLETHIKEMRRILDKENVMGRQLDFLLQEIHRETNTLSSKIMDTDIAHACVDLKVSIEQMREQVQNIE